MRARHLIACGLAALSLAAAGCSEEEAEESASGGETTATEQSTTAGPAESAGPAPAKPKPEVEVPEGRPPKELVTEDIEEGTGAAAQPGSQISVNYVGVSYSDGKEFDSSFNTGAPFQFQLGAGMVIPGWDQGLQGMKVGGRRRLVIPPDLAYGPQGFPPAIGPNETLVFVIDLLDVQ